MKCFIKVGLYVAACGLLALTILIPMLADVLAEYGPDVLTTTGLDGTKHLSPGTGISMAFLGFATFVGCVFGFIEASEIKCD